MNALENPLAPPDEPQNPTGRRPDYAWTDLTYLLHRHHVSWRYFVVKGAQPDCDDGAMVCERGQAERGHARDLEPAALVRHGPARPPAARHRPDVALLPRPRSRARLPAVSWVTPSNRVSEHPPSLVTAGQAFVTSVVNAVMRSPDWSSTAIFLAWDDWGGFYDHVVPPKVDVNGYGLRVPAS